MTGQASTNYPYLTAEIAGIGGHIKRREEDFLVDEIPLYPSCGEGTHVYVRIEKKSCTTLTAMNRIARALRVSNRSIGYAGLKDARAVTRQWISIEHVNPDDIWKLDVPNIRILEISRHTNKIKIGHLAGNRFVIKLRQTNLPVSQCLAPVRRILTILTQRGVPNYFGEQRFGARGDYPRLGAAIIRNDPKEFLDLLLGRPNRFENPQIQKARTYYEAQNYYDAFYHWPSDFSDQMSALKMLMKGATFERVFDCVDKRQKKFFVSSFQSLLFNQALAARMPDIDRLIVGDLAMKHLNGVCFRVENPALEQPRCDTREISPTGPIFGYKMLFPDGKQGELEEKILAEAGLKLDEFLEVSSHRASGCRRPLRFMPSDAQVEGGKDDLSSYVQLSFTLPSGCYATTLTREITKTDLDE